MTTTEEGDALLAQAGAPTAGLTDRQRRQAAELLHALVVPVMDDEEGLEALRERLADEVGASSAALLSWLRREVRRQRASA